MDVIDDVHQLGEAGYREVVITGANLGCYRDGANSLISLLEAVEGIQSISRVRISSIESTTVERQIVDFMAKSAKLCHFLHLPLQSTVLQRMGRRYSRDQYRAVVDYAVGRLPDLGLGTDIIVGFPGETDSQFANTLEFVRELPFSNLHVFSYSPRTGTPAADMTEQVDPSIKKERSAQLIALGKAKRIAFAKSFIGKPVTTLVERIDAGVAMGWSDQYLPVRITTGTHRVNNVVTFTPSSVDGDALV